MGSFPSSSNLRPAVYDNEIKLQLEGDPIGLELTGVLAQLFMVWWDRQMVKEAGRKWNGVTDVQKVRG